MLGDMGDGGPGGGTGEASSVAQRRMSSTSAITLGQLVTLRSVVNYVGRSSMEVGVRVEAEDTLTGERTHAASAYLTFVAIDASGKPTPVPALHPTTDAEKLRFEEAKARRAQRLALAKERHQLAEAQRLALEKSAKDAP